MAVATDASKRACINACAYSYSPVCTPSKQTYANERDTS